MVRPAILLPLIAAAGVVLTVTVAGGVEPIRIESVLLELIEQADVPARDANVIESLAVDEGKLVSKGDVLAQLDTAEAKLAVEQSQLEWKIAQQQADNDVDIRFAKKSLDVAEAELRRAIESVAEYAKSVSQTEIDRLKLTVERTRLEIEQAEHVLSVARLTAELKKNALKAAERELERLTIRAPADGLVAQVYRRPGEWVEPGQQVVRILRIDRLRAEGFLPATAIDATAVGSPVKLAIDRGGFDGVFEGVLVHVSPEIDPVNHQVRVWAEIENTQMLLKPGMHGAMTITPRADR